MNVRRHYISGLATVSATALALGALSACSGSAVAGNTDKFDVVASFYPMAYLAEWRLSVAADLLRDGLETVEAVGRRVGYANPFAFSTAFRRRHGVSPRDSRADARPSA